MNANLIRGKIVEKGLNQKKVAALMGITPTTLSLKLCGKHDFVRKEMEHLSKILEVDVGTLFFS